MEKAKITRNRAEAIEGYLYHNSKHELLRMHMLGHLSGDNFTLQLMNFDDLAQALYVGYEVEKTPEEKVRERFENQVEEFREAPEGSCLEAHHRGFMLGIKMTLKDLDKSIEGVNA